MTTEQSSDKLTRPAIEAPTVEESIKEIKIVLERVMYIMRWIAETPHHLVDGQHHDVLKQAIGTLNGRMQPILGRWNQEVLQSGPHARFAAHGLTGAEWALKWEAFDRHYRSFIDRTVFLEERYAALSARLGALETNDFVARVKKDVTGSLAVGTTIAESAAEVVSEIPGMKAALGSLKEAGGALSALLND